ncbi:phage major capsid family protein [Paraburkholderia metrosideri]|uniref:Phage capsid-like C-terminal domain-containing protein n=1 Tax=Paraburkholderia metrosideri TaxID=580937 RepID=A0ABN7IAA4_9BURK|nr:phage major capsid protein [Paraburkholderia metrosideri]CAD6553506.1 hypothetical protein LMG28140_05309 [Paraburkholderia metrosideri]
MDVMEMIRAALVERDAGLQKWVDTSAADMKHMGQQIESMQSSVIDLSQKVLREPGRIGGGAHDSLASLLCKHDALMQFRNGAERVRAIVPDFNIKAALLSTVVDPNGFPVPPQQILPVPLSPPRLWTALASLPTGSNALQVIDMDPEGAAAITPEGQLKPELVNHPSPRLVPVDTIAVHKTISFQLFEDAPALQGFLEAELRESCNDAMDAACVAALEAHSTPYTPEAGDTIIDAVLNVIGELYGRGGNGIVIALNPRDWVGMLLAKDQSGGFLVNPLQGLINGVAGATLVPTNAIARGTFVAASSPAGAFVALRSGFSFMWSREHDKNFVQNLVTFLLEMRAATVVQQSALVFTGGLHPATLAARPSTPTTTGKGK